MCMWIKVAFDNEELWIKNTRLIFNVKDFKLNLSIKAIKKIMNEFNDPFIIFFHLLRFVNPLYEEVIKDKKRLQRNRYL